MKSIARDRQQSVQRPPDRKPFRQPPRPIHFLQATNQDRSRKPFHADNQIQHLVDAITKVHIPTTARPIHNLCSRRASLASMAGQIFFTVVSFSFYDHMS